MRETLGMVLATLNAGLNLTAFCLVISGYRAIRRGDRERHARRMKAAVVTSLLFLVAYVSRVLLTGTHAFPHEGAVRTAYWILLGSHSVLAAITVPLVLITLGLALRARFAVHKKWARVTFPVWAYVSATGVIVYLMLYHLPVP